MKSDTTAALEADCHNSIIELDHVSFAYKEQKVISDFSFVVRERDFVGVIGSNGAGKNDPAAHDGRFAAADGGGNSLVRQADPAFSRLGTDRIRAAEKCL